MKNTKTTTRKILTTLTIIFLLIMAISLIYARVPVEEEETMRLIPEEPSKPLQELEDEDDKVEVVVEVLKPEFIHVIPTEAPETSEITNEANETEVKNDEETVKTDASKEDTIFGYPAEEVIDVLERLVFSEAENQPIDGQILVAATVINRYNDPNFPKDFYEILWAYMGDWRSVTHEQVVEAGTIEDAVERALQGEDPAAEDLGSPTLYFYNEATTLRWDPWTYAKIKVGVQKQMRLVSIRKNVSRGPGKLDSKLARLTSLEE